ncbi:geranylgeranyl pyrophosphate synthase [Flexivirga endophytica]|uniref:Geranylgeranyl pyrophosphate synthase n=1 Tax=Flexivirga endophytica TaxID=1849103 RepID=A0A916T2U6_9MICO|nr:polyprenyl synthetase family protein [Flexivirga endophytica]GGB28539.1 geranylgeranyl pyrophosphate synthase [Flexivirga endophytica]GHB62238.1 geranylgeranyl pyrophosphate synthase [Flexivirga endophytica]
MGKAASLMPSASDALADRLTGGLASVESRLVEVVQHEDEFIAGASQHLLTGGKRFRPLLTLLTSELGSGVNDAVIDAAVGVELTHIASLYHDDVMDAAERRHGKASVNAEYDNITAIIVGDLLFGRASEIVAGLGSEAARIQAQTFVRLCAGQIRDDRQAPADADPMEHYLGVLADKTGSLIATAARYGAMFGGCSAETVELLRQYGEYVGMVFQLSDDVLDIVSEESGKTPGTDLREGVTTLPVLYVRASKDPADARLQDLVSRPLLDDAEHAEALQLLRSHPALEQAQRHTAAVAEQAVALLEPLGDSDALAVLRDLPGQVASRTA